MSRTSLRKNYHSFIIGTMNTPTYTVKEEIIIPAYVELGFLSGFTRCLVPIGRSTT